MGEEFYIALEFVDGRDLSAVLHRCRDAHILLPVDFAIFIARSLLDALAFVHEARGPSGNPLNVVHCNVSPSNVFVSNLGVIKLGDFGIAKVRALDKFDASDLVWGKLAYLSPEQLAGHGYDGRADIWSAGTLLYEVLTNRKPFGGKTADELKAAIRNSEPRSITSSRNISVGLENVILKALEKSPEARYQSAREFSEALSPFYESTVGTPLGIAAVIRGLFPDTARSAG